MKNKQMWLILALCWLMLVWGAGQTRAADAVVGDGSPASCTEAAFDTALTTAVSGGGTITFNCGAAEATIPFSLSKIVNLGNVTIDGADRIILNANNNDRHFFIGSGVTFRLQNITLRDGNSLVNGGAIEASGATLILENVRLLNNYSSVAGGAIYCYDSTLTMSNSLLENNASDTAGAIYNDGCAMTISGSTLRGNQALDTFGRGGAIENRPLGDLTLTGTRLENNAAPDGGGLYNATGATAQLTAVTLVQNTAGYGGGVENSGALTVTHSLFDGNNTTGSGGGLWNLGGTAVIETTTFTDNFAYEGGGVNSYGAVLEMRDVNLVNNYANALSGTPHGGGLYHAGGTAFITNATIQGNYAASNGGGIYQASDDNLVLTNVTIAGNVATGLGGGLYHYGRYAVLTNATLANNQAGIAGNAIYEDSPQTPAEPGVVQLINTVIFGAVVNCDGGLFQSLGHNLSQGNCASLTDPTDQDSFTGDLLLGDLAFNGGAFPMQTLLPLPGSPLIDAGDPTFCNATDQRGGGRLGVCDLGAVEFGASVMRVYLPLVIRP
jgi:predicted outer membrane repeat protein